MRDEQGRRIRSPMVPRCKLSQLHYCLPEKTSPNSHINRGTVKPTPAEEKGERRRKEQYKRAARGHEAGYAKRAAKEEQKVAKYRRTAWQAAAKQ